MKRPRKATDKDVFREPARKGGFRAKHTAAAEISLLPSVAMSEHDKASQISLDRDQLICYGSVVSGPDSTILL